MLLNHLGVQPHHDFLCSSDCPLHIPPSCIEQAHKLWFWCVVFACCFWCVVFGVASCGLLQLIHGYALCTCMHYALDMPVCDRQGATHHHAPLCVANTSQMLVLHPSQPALCLWCWCMMTVQWQWQYHRCHQRYHGGHHRWWCCCLTL